MNKTKKLIPKKNPIQKNPYQTYIQTKKIQMMKMKTQIIAKKKNYLLIMTP